MDVSRNFRESSVGRAAEWVYAKTRVPELTSDPHMPPAETSAFKELLKKSHSYLEYGAGGSTIYASAYVPQILSIETDRIYAWRLKNHFRDVNNVRVVHQSVGHTGIWGRPIDTEPTPVNIKRWQKYADAPWEMYENDKQGLYPDTVLIDGRFRVNSALTSLLRVRDGHDVTFMFDDYFSPDRNYGAIEPFIRHINDVGRALIFKKSDRFDENACREAQARYVLDWM